MKSKGRIALVAGLAVLAVLGATGYVAYAKHRQDAATANAPNVDTRDDLSQLSTQPRLVFRNTALGKDYGRVAIVSTPARPEVSACRPTAASSPRTSRSCSMRPSLPCGTCR